MKYFCECGKRVLVFRRIRKPGRHFGKLKIFADRRYTLCRRHLNALFQSEMQKKEIRLSKT